MKTIDRLMLKSFLGPMILAFCIVMFILLMNFLWQHIDDLVGKGLTAGVIAELLMYTLIIMMPMGLPLATLFGAIMTMGNMGENYELLAMKSAGMSLPRIIKSVFIVVVMISIGSFFVSNNLVPYATQQSQALIYDINNQKQNIEFKDGIFFTEIDNMSIRVGRQVGQDKQLKEILIYDNTDRSSARKMSTTLADSGYIKLSDDKKNLLVTLYNGAMYEVNRPNYRNEWYEKSNLTGNYFEHQYIVNPLSGFDLERSDTELFANGKTKKISQLQRDIDSLDIVVNKRVADSYGPLFSEYVFRNDAGLMVDSLRPLSSRVKPAYVMDSIARLDIKKRQQLWKSATSTAQNSRSMFRYDEDMLKRSLNDFYIHQISWHEKVSLPFSIMIFFLIGAALGAIIRRGGLGMPVVVSVLFFVFYYIISIFGTKMAREGTISAMLGVWSSSIILLPIAVFLIYKATNDSNLFNPEWYIYRYRAVKGFIKRLIKGKQYNDTIQQSA